MKQLSRPLPVLLATLCLAGSSAAQASFFTLPHNGSFVQAVTPDGTWFAGGSVFGGANFRYSSATGFEPFTAGSSGLPDIAVGGSPVAATLFDLNGVEFAGLWTPSGSTLLPGLGGQSGNSVSSTYAASDDASVVVGLAWINAGKAHAFKWTQATGTVDLGSLNNQSSRANGVSGDGAIVVGWDEDPTGPRIPVYWNATGQHFIGTIGEAWGASQDGSVISGDDNGNCFRWTAATGTVDLGKLRGSDPIFDTATGLAISADGQTIVGVNGNAFFGTPPRAFIWREGAGMTDLRELLLHMGVTTIGGNTLSAATCVSADGRTIGGSAGFLFTSVGFIATLPPVATAYCTGQTTSEGCASQIAFTGTPSSRTSKGFRISASNVLPNQTGVLLYSTAGRASVPFQGGTLCLATPYTRLSVAPSGGSGPCTGRFEMDFNTYVKSGADAALHAGTHVWAQFLSRDPASAGGTNLSDALDFVLWP